MQMRLAISRLALASSAKERAPEVATRRQLTNTELIELMDKPPVDDPELLEQADHYERLEFLGDAIIQFAFTVGLYHAFPNASEVHSSIT